MVNLETSESMFYAYNEDMHMCLYTMCNFYVWINKDIGYICLYIVNIGLMLV